MFFAEPASLETGVGFFFAGQGPANKDPLRIPSGIEAIPVKSGQQETSVGFYLSLREKNPTLVSIEVEPGCQETGVGFFFAGPPNFLQQVLIFRPAKKSYTCPKKILHLS